MKRIKYQHMMSCNKLDRFIEQDTKKEAIADIGKTHKKCGCGNWYSPFNGQTKCGHCLVKDVEKK